MKNTLKKFIAIMLAILLLFNFVYSNYIPVFAADDDDAAKEVIEDITNIAGGIVGLMSFIPRLIGLTLAMGASLLIGEVAYVDGTVDGATRAFLLTPFEIFFNEIQLIDINFLDIDAADADSSTTIIRTQIAKWYYIVRLMAIIILLLILIYVGIRMAISSVATEKAIYKKSLIDWTVSIALVFVLQYIIMFTIQANSAIVSSLKALVDGADMGKILDIAKLSIGASWAAMAATVIYIIIVVQTLIFLIKYIKRMLTVGFLIVISPLISIKPFSSEMLSIGKVSSLIIILSPTFIVVISTAS